MMELLAFAGVLALTYFGVGLFRRWSLHRQLLDIPNERSSHVAPTPRGGGLIVVVISLSSYLIYTIISGQRLMWGYFAGAILIAVVSWLDDLYSISFIWRFLIHSLAAALVLYDAGFWQSIYFPVVDSRIELGPFGAVLSFLWIVWLTNAYNFMDGIDGISGMQAVTAGLGWMLLGYLIGFPVVSFYGGILAFSSLGFLVHNWPPAKIFLGDVGSAFLGFSFAVMPFLAGSEHSGKPAPLPIIALLLVWYFVFDTVLTFFSRLLRRHRVWEPHREHLYQQLIISGLSHRFVSLLYGFLSILIVLSLILARAFRGNFEILLSGIVVSGTFALLIFTYSRKVLT